MKQGKNALTSGRIIAEEVTISSILPVNIANISGTLAIYPRSGSERGYLRVSSPVGKSRKVVASFERLLYAFLDSPDYFALGGMVEHGIDYSL